MVAATAAKLDPSGERALAVTCDVSKEEQVKAAVLAAVEQVTQ